MLELLFRDRFLDVAVETVLEQLRVQAVSINTRPPIFSKEIILVVKNGVFPLKIANYRYQCKLH